MQKQQFILAGLFFSLLIAVSCSGSGRAAEAQPAATSVQGQQTAPGSPLMFIENVGQFASGARFQMRGGDRTIWLAEDAIWITLLEPAAPTARPNPNDRFLPDSQPGGPHRLGVNVRLSFAGASPAATPEPFDPLDTTISYFIGSDPEEWRPAVPVWGGVRYVDLYPGVDLELSGSRTLQPRLVCRADDCPAVLAGVALQVEGAEELLAGEAGLQVRTTVGGFTLPWLEVVDREGGSVVIHNLETTVAGDLALRPFAIQPASFLFAALYSQDSNPAGSELLYSTLLGGSSVYDGGDSGASIAVDGAGNAFVAGVTRSTDFPTTAGAFDITYNGGGDAFITKINATGSDLVYSTFLGGNFLDWVESIAVDGAGNAFITGSTSSSNFPTTPGAFDTTHNDAFDTFTAKINAAGSDLIYSTFLGGENDDRGYSIAVDGTGNTFIAGETRSTDFPTTPGAFDTTFNGFEDAFVIRLNSAGSDLLYSTFLGGSDGGMYGWDRALGIAVDGGGHAFIVGETGSTDFPATPGAFDATHNGALDTFVTKFSATGSDLLYSTFLGGGSNDAGIGIAVGVGGSAFVTGVTWSSDFPTTPGAFDTIYNGDGNAFVTKLNAIGSDLIYSTFLGGSEGWFGWEAETGRGIVVDGAGNALVTGHTPYIDFPTTPGAFDTTYNGYIDAFVTKLNPAGSDLLYSTFLGGEGLDGGIDIVVDGAGTAFVTGYTGSDDFPTTPGAYDTTYSGDQDAIVVRLVPASARLFLPILSRSPTPHP